MRMTRNAINNGTAIQLPSKEAGSTTPLAANQHHWPFVRQQGIINEQLQYTKIMYYIMLMEYNAN